MTPESRSRHGFDAGDKGALVTEVQPGSAAASVGIRPGDLIVSVGGQPITNVGDFRNVVKEQQVQNGIRMQLMRDGVRRFVFIKVRE